MSPCIGKNSVYNSNHTFGNNWKQFFSKLPARVLDVLAGVCKDFFHAMDFGCSEHSEEKVYEVYTQSGIRWSTVSIGTGAVSYKRLVQVSPIFSAFTVSFLELYGCIHIVYLSLLLKCLFWYGLLKWNIK